MRESEQTGWNQLARFPGQVGAARGMENYAFCLPKKQLRTFLAYDDGVHGKDRDQQAKGLLSALPMLLLRP